MHKNKLYDEILNLKVSKEAILEFGKDLSKRDFDEENAFDKYYSFKIIKTALIKHQNRELNYQYFSNWCNAYNWIINGGFKNRQENDRRTMIEQVIMEEISWSLDSLSFVDKNLTKKDVNRHIEEFRILDEIYKNFSDWKVLYTSVGNVETDNEQYAIFFNDRIKKFSIIYIDQFKNEYQDDQIVKLSISDLIEKLEFLKKNYFFDEYAEISFRDVELKRVLK